MNSSTTARCTDFRTVKDWGRSSTRCDTARVSTQVFVNTVFGGSIFFVLADDADFHERLRRSAYLAKVRVAGSNLVVRSTRTPCSAGGSAVFLRSNGTTIPGPGRGDAASASSRAVNFHFQGSQRLGENRVSPARTDTMDIESLLAADSIVFDPAAGPQLFGCTPAAIGGCGQNRLALLVA